jgi:subtilisin-like proprotein convertase family protein
VPKGIYDFATTRSIVMVPENLKLADVNVGPLTITHSWDSDLNVYLSGPTGTRVLLFSRVGGGGKNFANTALDDEASTSISFGAAPFAGTYKPQGLLSTLDGKASVGEWTLSIYDAGLSDTGTLDSWTLELCGEPDQDNDGFADDKELYMGTDPLDACGPGAWPPDFNDTGRVTVADLQLFSSHYAPRGGTYAARYDLNASGPPKITSADLVIFAKYYWASCTVG